MNIRSVVPEWLLDLLMGYLDPAAAHYSRRPEHYLHRQTWLDTFLSPEHTIAAFPQYHVRFVDRRRWHIKDKLVAKGKYYIHVSEFDF
ncbi:unnamed protein product [Protopolystoma xenopodis]|uniref:Uncharacterized protein n=1 Tax=Protopolystoma xenopodis TaxID=117903 RepID=A0A448XPW7_9PLAT|nr:unnamed protein product [Protopolystoma xenopodis]